MTTVKNESQGAKEFLYRCSMCGYIHIESEYRKSIECKECPPGHRTMSYLGEQPVGTGIKT